jgi:O-methyltransferase involved in polyketide biosynthesis
MEGVFFFLQSERARSLLDPHRLGLAAGSMLLLDAWTPLRARSLNRKLVAHAGRPLFGEAQLGDDSPAVIAALERKGYAQIEVTTLDDLCREYGVARIADPMPRSWLVIRAQVA